MTARGLLEQHRPAIHPRQSARPVLEDATDELPFKTLTAVEARQVRETLGFVSPWRVVAVQLLAGLGCALVIGLLWREASMVWSALVWRGGDGASECLAGARNDAGSGGGP